MGILKELNLTDWQTTPGPDAQTEATHALEQEKIVYLPKLGFKLSPEESELLSDSYQGLKAKNVSFDCRNNTLRGIQCDLATQDKLISLLSRFNRAAHNLVNHLFPSYADALEVARTSYRPIEVAGRKSPSYKKDDTRLHIDAFPSNPVQGKRILRVFTNINPNEKPRLWHAGEDFSMVAKRFLPQIKKPFLSGKFLKSLGLTKSIRTPYDHIMLQIHDRMKADERYQEETKKIALELSAGATWIVQTDCVSHAALSGQHLLEQTFYLPVDAMLNATRSPLRILEQLSGQPLL